MIFNKKLEEISYDDIQNLIVDEIPESVTLDYKQGFPNENDPKYSDKQKIHEEVAKDITGLANTQGGYLIYGVSEDNDKNLPKEIVGIERKYCNSEVDDWLSSFMNNGGVSYKVNYNINKISIPDAEKIILIIEIPESLNKPHMIKFTESGYCYYKRFGTSTKKADHTDVIQMFEFKNNFLENFKNFKTEINISKDSSNLGMTPFSERLTNHVNKKPVEDFILINFIPYNLNRKINFVRDINFQNYISQNYSININLIAFLPNKRLDSDGLFYPREMEDDKFLRYFAIYKNGSMEYGKGDFFDLDNNQKQLSLNYIRLIHTITTLLYHQIGLHKFVDSIEWNFQLILKNLKNAKVIIGNYFDNTPYYYSYIFNKTDLIIDLDYTIDELNPVGIEEIVGRFSDELLSAFGVDLKFDEIKNAIKFDDFKKEFNKLVN